MAMFAVCAPVKRDVESVGVRLCDLEERLMAGMHDTMRLQEM